MSDHFYPVLKTENSVETNMLVLYSKTLKILSVIISALSISETSKAQVQYTDVNPDFLYSNSIAGYLLDLNNDGIDDFKLIRESEYWWCGAGGYSGPNYYGGKWGMILENLDTLASNRSRLDQTASCYPYFQKVQKMQVNTLLALNPTSWSNYNPLTPWKAIYAEYSGCSAPCSVTNPSNVDLFIGLRIGVPGAFHLGWLRIQIASGFVIVKDYAFETTPNRPIIIGSTTSSVGINDIEGASKIILNGKDLSLQFFNESAKYQIHVSNLAGQVIESSDNVGLLWNYSFNQPGVYMVTIANESGKYTKKLIVF